MSDVGHNSVSKDQLRSIIERIERLSEEKKTISDDIAGIFTEAKGNGYCSKTLRKIVAMRKKNPADRAEEEAILETYLHALDMLA